MAKDYPITKKDLIYAGLIVLGGILYAHGTTFATANNAFYIKTGKIMLYVGLGLLIIDRVIKYTKSKK